MKAVAVLPRVAILFVLSLFAARAQTPAPAAQNRHGYTVTLEAKVSETGEKESLSIISSDDPTPDHFIDKLAAAMALKTPLAPREKNGKPAKYTARIPFFFPIEGDEGPDANAAPKPSVKRNGGIPAYPPELKEKGVVGGAILELQVDEHGKLTKLTTLRASHPEFEAASREVISRWEFNPAEKDGQPVACRWNIAVVFETDQDLAELQWRVAPRPSLGTLQVLFDTTPVTENAPDSQPAPAPAAADKK